MNDSDFASPALADGRRSPSRDSERPTRVRYQVLASACSLAVITYIHRVGFATASAEFKTPLGLTDTHIGWLMAAFMIGYGLFEMPWGFLGDRFGVRNMLAAIILGGLDLTAAVALVAFLPAQRGLDRRRSSSSSASCSARFQAGTFPAISRMMADWMPTTERGSAQGAIWMSAGSAARWRRCIVVWLFAVMGDWKVPCGARRCAWACSGARSSGRGFATGPRRCRRSTGASGS